MNKNFVLMRDVICQFHPSFRASSDLRRYGLAHSDIFNVERLIEESLAAVGPYDYVDEHGYDFTDYSDSKTVTVQTNQKRRAEVNSVEHKIGALRVTAYNPFKQGLDYFFVPHRRLVRIRQACYGQSSHKQRLIFTYTLNEDYGYFEEFRVPTFEDLALAA